MAASMYNGYVLVYGGSGALGSGCVSQFKQKNWWVASIEVFKSQSLEASRNSCVHIVHDDKSYMNQNPNPEADYNLLVDTDKSLQQQENDLLSAVEKILNGNRLNAIICVAGGYVPGNVQEDFVANCEKMWKQNMWPSIISAKIAANHLKEKGMLCLTGAKVSLGETSSAVGYGFCKAAVHQLTKSLAHPASGLPNDSFTVCLLPVTLDTVMNRQMMPTADISGWTPTKYITELAFKWAKGIGRPANGSLIQFVTQNFNTDISYL